MSLQYIIDAYNIINHPQFRALAKQSSSVQHSLDDFIRLNRLTGSAKNRAALVFDGYPALGQEIPAGEGLIWIYSRKIDADEKIKKLVEESGNPREIIVVSDDRQVQLAARLLHARVSGVKEFICGKKSNKPVVAIGLDSLDSKLTYSQIQKINAELKERWLG